MSFLLFSAALDRLVIVMPIIRSVLPTMEKDITHPILVSIIIDKDLEITFSSLVHVYIVVHIVRSIIIVR